MIWIVLVIFGLWFAWLVYETTIYEWAARAASRAHAALERSLRLPTGSVARDEAGREFDRQIAEYKRRAAWSPLYRHLFGSDGRKR